MVRNAAQVRTVIESAGNVRGVLQGHCHPGTRASINGIPYIGMRAMVTGPGRAHNAYAVVTLARDGRIVVEGYGQQESFRM